MLVVLYVLLYRSQDATGQNKAVSRIDQLVKIHIKETVRIWIGFIENVRSYEEKRIQSIQ
jgi:hypothetical protein